MTAESQPSPGLISTKVFLTPLGISTAWIVFLIYIQCEFVAVRCLAQCGCSNTRGQSLLQSKDTVQAVCESAHLRCRPGTVKLGESCIQGRRG